MARLGTVVRVVLWLAGFWRGWLGSFRYGSLRCAMARNGWRVMVRLGAALCGTVMYGLAWLARLGEARSVTAV